MAKHQQRRVKRVISPVDLKARKIINGISRTCVNFHTSTFEIFNKSILFLLQNLQISKWLMDLCFAGFDFCIDLWGKPDYAAAIIFNEQPYTCRGKHDFKFMSNRLPLCTKRHCEVCRVQRIVKYIDNAKCSIDVAQLTISSQILLDAILRAHARGVNIRLLTDREMIYVRGSVIFHLVASGVHVRICREGMMMHHKFCIIDAADRLKHLIRTKHCAFKLRHHRGLVMTGSLNWTRQGTFANFENVVITSNIQVILAYQPIFDFMWENFEPLHLGKMPKCHVDLY